MLSRDKKVLSKDKKALSKDKKALSKGFANIFFNVFIIIYNLVDIYLYNFL